MILLLRHGQTEFNAEQRLQGQLDAPLTALGREQAARMGARVAALASGREVSIHASPLGRARTSAVLVAAAFAVAPPLRYDARLMELSVGDWEGRTVADIEAAHPGLRAAHPPGHWLFHAPGGEGLAALRTRTAAALAAVQADPAPVRVIVAHGVTNWALRMVHSGQGPEEAFIGKLPQDAVMELLPGGGWHRHDLPG